VLILFINDLRANEQFAWKPAILSMDNCSIRTRPEVSTILSERDFKVITFRPHKTQIFLALDLSLFRVLKRHLQDKLPLGNDDLTVAFIQKAFHSLKQMCIPDNVRNVLKILGFEFSIAKSPYARLLRDGKLLEIHRLREMWDTDYSLDRLSKRRRETRYRWVRQDSRIREIVITYLFSNEILKYLGFNIRFTFGLGAISAMMSLVKWNFLSFTCCKKCSGWEKSIRKFESGDIHTESDVSTFRGVS
jgi:hypothetical protein